MRFVSWNVNGLRACVNKGFLDRFRELDADFFCLQETKLQEGQIDLDLPGYHQYWCYAQKKGYSGTAIFTRYEPQSVTYGLGTPELDTEGRVICLEYPEFYLVTCYTPNAQRGLARIDHRLRWEEAFRGYLKELDAKKPVIICGDLNVAHKEIDLKNPGSNRGNAGFSDEERSAFSALLDSGFTDTFRHLYPDKTGAYSWWSYMYNARANNAGWRIDYFLVSDRLKEQIYDATIHPDIMGSDHCPVGLDLDTTCNGGIRIPTPDMPLTDTPKEADGDAPVGSFQPWRLLSILMLLLVLIATPMLLFMRSQNDTQPQPSITTPPDDPLIYKILDRTGTLEFEGNSGMFETTSSIQISSFWFTNGHRTWQLLDAEQHLTTARNATYCIQIQFDPGRIFTADDKPEIIAFDMMQALSSTLSPNDVSYCYYWENDRIGGCFVFGTSLDPTSITVTARYQKQTETTDPIEIQPVFSSALIDRMEVHPADVDIYIDGLTSAADHQISFRHAGQIWYALNDHHPTSNKWDPNFYILICFPEVAFTRGDHPIVETEYLPEYLRPESEDFALDILYIHQGDGRICGAFVYGYTSADFQLSITVSYTDAQGIQRVEGRCVYFYPDHAGMESMELAYSLMYSNELSYYICSGADGYWEEMIKNSPALQELLSREDAIRAILSVNRWSSPGTYFDTILALDHFQAMMTEDEKAIFKEQAHREDDPGEYSRYPSPT
ncbi:MAG: exodeoxyribonuclease III [Oscillospiraceae bacterium]|nr:exodeoxyribonuclease III [Oscillospiraceae bacterium]